MNVDEGRAFHDFWGEIADPHSRLGDQPTLLVGDINTCLLIDSQSGRPLPGSQYLQRLVGTGRRDAFREPHPAADDRS